MKYKLVLLFLFFSAIAFADVTERYVFASEHQERQFQRLTYELRCLVCQNQNIAESNAPLALDLRNQIAQMIVANKSNQEIKHFLATRYGNFILYKPPILKSTWILWIFPFVLLVLGSGGVLLWIYFRNYKLSS